MPLTGVQATSHKEGPTPFAHVGGLTFHRGLCRWEGTGCFPYWVLVVVGFYPAGYLGIQGVEPVSRKPLDFKNPGE